MKPNRKSLFLAVALAMVIALAAAWPCAAAVPKPTPIDLGALEGHSYSEANAINAAGQVVGISYNTDAPPTLPFIWQNGVMTQLPLPEGYGQGSAMDINTSGRIAGICFNEATNQACLWTPDSSGWTVTVLDRPTFTYEGYEFTFTDSLAFKINDAGQVLALTRATVIVDEMNREFVFGAIWQDNNWTLLTDSYGAPVPVSPDPNFTMNNNGQVLFGVLIEDEFGEDYNNLWLWDNGTASLLVEDIGWANLNNSGQIVGVHYNHVQQLNKNFTYDTDGKMLTVSPVSEDGYSLVNINDNGQVLVAYPTTREWDQNGVFIGTTVLGITSFNDWSLGTASVTSLGSVDGYVNHVGLNFNANGEVSGDGYSDGSAFYASAAGVVSLYDLVAGSAPQVTAMNDSGIVIGQSGGHAVLWGEVTPPASVLDFSGATLTRKGKTVTITVKTAVTNPSSEPALNTFVDAATLGGSTPTTNLPLKIGTIKPGASKTVSLTFKDVPAGEVTLNIKGACSLGSFFTTQTVRVP